MTTQPLSYNVLKNVLEYLTLDKRTQIAKYCPSLKSAERKATLHLNRLCLNSDPMRPQYDCFLRIDDLNFIAGHSDNNSTNSEVQTILFVKREFLDCTEEFSTEPENVMKKIIEYFFADRDIKVRYMEIINEPQGLVLLPDGLKIECKELRTHNRLIFSSDVATNRRLREDQLRNIRAIRPYLTDTPLEKLFIYELDPENPLFQEEVVRHAKYLEIRKDLPWNRSNSMDFLGLNCMHIHVDTWMDEYCFSKEEVVNMAKLWLATCPKLGTCFTVSVWENNYVSNVIDLLIKECGAVRGEEMENDVVRHYVTIPMRSGHQLNVIGELQKKQRALIAGGLLRMEVMEPGFSIC